MEDQGQVDDLTGPVKNSLIDAASDQALALTQALLDRCSFDDQARSYDLACSGGADSTALAVLAVATGKSVTLHHVDHGLRPTSGDDVKLVERLAVHLGCLFKSYDVVVGAGPNLEARARKARFSVLPEGVITGHHMDDQAETLLLNLMRGSGARGLAAMRPGPSKPLLDLRKSELEALCEAYGLRVACDETNQDRSLRRNAIRADLLPMMAALSERDLVPVLARVARLARSDDDALEQLSMSLIGDPTVVADLVSAPEALRRRAIRRLIRDAGAGILAPSEAEVERIEAVVMGSVVAAQIEGALEIRRSKGVLNLKVIEDHYASDDVT
jgi:tRNA(Ile)-lysidine synthase